MRERVLVTGASGFVGRSLVSYLSSRGYEVVTLDITGEPTVKVDVLDFDGLLEVFKLYKPLFVIHLAGIANPTSCMKDEYTCMKVNSQGTLNVLEAAKRMAISKLIYASSANVYGAKPPLPVTEDAPIEPRSPYDYSKVAAEVLVRSYSFSVPSVILRSWKLFGEFDSESSVVSRFVDLCLKGEPLKLYNGGRDVTDPYHVENYCLAVELAMRSEKSVSEVFNVGTGCAVSIRELAEKIRQLTNSSSELQLLPPRSEVESEPMVSYPSIEKISRELGYRPIVGLEEGLRRVIEYRRSLLS